MDDDRRRKMRQLAAIQGYLGTHIGRYQKEILRLRERLNYLEKAS